MEIQKLAVISTSHLSPDATELLRRAAADSLATMDNGPLPDDTPLPWSRAAPGTPEQDLIVYPTSYGWWLMVSSPEEWPLMAENGVPADLLAIIERAHADGCGWIRFDADAEEVDGLPLFAQED